MLVRADSAYYQQGLIAAIVKAGCQFSVGARLNTGVRAAIATLDDQAWVPIVYPNAITDPDTGELISTAEVAEVAYTAFTSHRTGRVAGRLIVRRVPERNTRKLAAAAQDGLLPGLALPRRVHQPDHTTGRGRESPPRSRSHRASVR